MPVWRPSLSKEEWEKWEQVVTYYIDKVFKTDVGKWFKLEEYEEAVKYSVENTIHGKSVFNI